MLKQKSKSASNYEVELVWDRQTGGIVEVEGQPRLKLDIPKEYGGLGRYYCSDEVFLASLAGCLLATFIDFKRKFRLHLRDARISLSSSLELRRDGYHVTRIWGSLDLVLGKGRQADAKRCAELAKEYCHLTRAIRETIPIEILVNFLEKWLQISQINY